MVIAHKRLQPRALLLTVIVASYSAIRKLITNMWDDLLHYVPSSDT